MNSSGQIAVVAPNDWFGYTRGFLWVDGGFVDLSCFVPEGLFVLRPLDVNDDGVVNAVDFLLLLANFGG